MSPNVVAQRISVAPKGGDHAPRRADKRRTKKRCFNQKSRKPFTLVESIALAYEYTHFSWPRTRIFDPVWSKYSNEPFVVN